MSGVYSCECAVVVVHSLSSSSLCLDSLSSVTRLVSGYPLTEGLFRLSEPVFTCSCGVCVCVCVCVIVRDSLLFSGCIDILVTHNDQGSHSTPPPWSGDILAHCGGRVEKVQVELISGKYPPKAPPTARPTSNVKCNSSYSLDHSVGAPDTHRVNVEVQTTPGVRGVEGLQRSGYPSKRSLGDPNIGRLGNSSMGRLGDPSVGRLGDPSVRVSNDEFPSLLDLNMMTKILPTETIIFPLTMVNSSSGLLLPLSMFVCPCVTLVLLPAVSTEQSFQIHNPHSGAMSWLVTHVSPPRIRDTTAPDAAVSKETIAVFWIHQNNGSVPPLSSVEVGWH